MRARLLLILGAAIVLGALPGLHVPATEAADPGSWSVAPGMSVSRSLATYTTLPNGKILVIGGNTPGLSSGGHPVTRTLATVEIYTPSTNTWAPAASMSLPRAHHTATLLRDGRVLVTGGMFADASGIAFNLHNSTEIYTPATNIWTPGPPMADYRRGSSATTMLDGRVLVANREVFDPATDSWSPIAPPLPGEGPAFTLPSGYVISGFTLYRTDLDQWFQYGIVDLIPNFPWVWLQLANGDVLVHGSNGNRTYKLTAATLQWAEVASSPPGTSFGTGLVLGNGKVLFSTTHSSAAAMLYDPVSNTWSDAADRPTTVGAGEGKALLHDGRALFFGEWPYAELYDPTAWLPAAPPVAPRSGHTATLLWNGRTLVAGGGTAAAETYDESTNTWSSAGTMSAPRENHAAARLNDGRVLVVGGTNGPSNGSNDLLTAEIYSPNTNSWSPAASPALAHTGGSAVVLPDGRVFAYGANSSGAGEIYSPTTNTWAPATPNNNAGITGPAYRTSAGRVLTLDFGGTHVYDPATDTWSLLINYPGPFLPGRGDNIDGTTKIVIAGGNDVCPMAQTPTSKKVVTFDGVTQGWTSAAALAASRASHSATALYGGKLLVAGGHRNVATCQTTPITYLSSAELYNATANTWTSAGELAAPRHAHTATRLTSGNVLIVGGRDSTGVVPTAERYDLGISSDLDGDGYNDGLEVALGHRPWLNCKTMRADVNGDGIVNVGDIGKIAQNFGLRPPQARLDQNNDRVINIADRGLASTQFSKSVLSCA